VNRSPSAYLNNPASERSKYKYDVDKEMTLLKFVDDKRGPVGSFNWFATHATSMGHKNSLISGDNKGAASRFMEDWFERKDSGRHVKSCKQIICECINLISPILFYICRNVIMLRYINKSLMKTWS
jgi:hypothetical protein